MATPKTKDFKPSPANISQRLDLVRDVIRNAKIKSSGDIKQHPSVMLAGDPGIGKTQFLEQFASLMGLSVITIEAPHIIEEHLINIPYIVTDTKGKQTGGETEVVEKKYSIEIADSNLYTALNRVRKNTDKQYLSDIYTDAADDTKAIFEELGGNETTVPPDIEILRSKYRVILFLDEYFRTTVPRILKMLRGILNNKLGLHDIPKDILIIYASNISDVGGSLAKIPKNAQLPPIDFPVPTKDEWFSWLVYKFKQEHRGVTLKKEVINKFYHALNDEHISYFDPASKVRTSPRRWEQLLLYVNESLPVKDEHEARQLLTNVKVNFRNYVKGGHSELVDTVMKAVSELIEETSHFDVAANNTQSEHDWRSTLEHQIKLKMKLGDHRKYVPVIAGEPGIGKTTHIQQIADDLDLRLIDFEVDKFNAEDATGLVTPHKEKGKKMETRFSTPMLYRLITDKIKKEDEEHIAQLKADGKTREAKEYPNKRWKYLIFFDELNRASDPKVFNALRRVLLEKNFGPSDESNGEVLKLPEGSIMVAAINPDPKEEGVIEFTDHVKDVLDIIPAAPNWNSTVQHLEDTKVPYAEDNAAHTTLDVIKKFVDKFKTKEPSIQVSERPFYINIGKNIYVQPREYKAMYLEAAVALTEELQRIRKHDLKKATADELKEYEQDAKLTLYKSIRRFLLGLAVIRNNIKGTEFFEDLKTWFLHSPEIDIGEGLFYHVGSKVKRTFLGVFDDIFEGNYAEHLADNQDFINYLENITGDITKFKESLTEFIEKKLKDPADIEKYLTKDDYPLIVLKDGEIKEDKGKKVTLLANLMSEARIALIMHEYDNSMVEALGVGVLKAITAFLKTHKDKGFYPPEVAAQISELYDTVFEI
jgi:MoxR-like ATPase